LNDPLTRSLLVLVVFFIFIVWIGGFFRGIGIAHPDQNSLLVYALIFLIIGVHCAQVCRGPRRLGERD